MAVVQRLSGAITNRDADPVVKVNSSVMQGEIREAAGTIETVSGDSIGSTYIMCEVPSNARISELVISSDDIGSTTIADFGIYKNTENSNTVVDADFFASALSLKDGALSAVDITHESAVFGLEDGEKPLWEALGLTQDPHLVYDIVATLTAAADAAGTILVKCKYAI